MATLSAGGIRIGRPPKNQFPIFQAYLQGIREGLTFEAAAKRAGADDTTIVRWRAADPRLERELQEVLAQLKNARIEKFLDFVRIGHFSKDAAILSGLNEAVLRKWASEDPELQERINTAFVYFKDVHLRAVQDPENAKNKAWIPHAWMLERRFSQEYGLRSTVSLDNNIEEMKRRINAGRERLSKLGAVRDAPDGPGVAVQDSGLIQ